MSDNKHFEIKLDILIDSANTNGRIYPKEIFEKAFAKNNTFPVTLNNEVIGSVEIMCNKNGIDAVGYVRLNDDLVSMDGE